MPARVTPLEFLEAVYDNDELPLSVRMRAAIEAAPYVHPKFTAVGYMREMDTFAVRLERAIERSNGARLIEGRAVEVPRDGEGSG